MLTTTCAVCGVQRKYKSLCYDQQLVAYCNSAYQCAEDHPNSIENIKKRGSILDFYNAEQAQSVAMQKTEAIYGASAQQYNRRIRDVEVERLTHTLSFRVRTVQQADYLAYLMAKEGIAKVSQAIHWLINFAIERDPSFNAKAISKAITPFKPIEKKKIAVVQPTSTDSDDDEVFTI